MNLDRRSVILGALGLAACDFPVAGAVASVPPLRGASAHPIGCTVTAAECLDVIASNRLAEQFSQLTPEFEMKMNALQRSDGSRSFGAADIIMAYAKSHGQSVHGHALVWYLHQPAYFTALANTQQVIGRELDRYIADVCGHFRGAVRGWDVVNEPLSPNGEMIRPCLWSNALGDDGYIIRSFEAARQADPDAILFLNEYDLESRPEKRLAFLKLVERLLRAGSPIDGIGTQTHATIDLADGAIAETLRELAGFGLKIHVSELDISFGAPRFDIESLASKRARQAQQARAIAEAYLALPAEQHYAFTLWGMIDSQSHLRRPPRNLVDDEPLAFDESGRPKPMARAIYDAFAAAPPAQGDGVMPGR